MDEVNNARIQPQGSVCSDFNGDDNNSNNNEMTSANSDGLRRLCLVGNVANDEVVCNAANSFGIPVVASKTGAEYAADDSCTTIFVLDKFEGDVYNSLFKAKHSLLGTTALQQLARDKKPLPMNTRPLFCLAMTGVVVCFTGFRDKEDLIKLVPIIHHMGGSIRKEMCSKVTHLIANVSGGDKYNYANTFRVPIMNFHWVFASWERRYDLAFSAVADNIVNEHKLKPFHGLRVCFVGFAEEEEKHMTEVLISNGGSVTKSDDDACTHMVVDESNLAERPDEPSKSTKIVKAEWFWTSVQKQSLQKELDYLYDDYVEQILSPNSRRDSHAATPANGSRRKRKRIQDNIIKELAAASPGIHKRRSSVSDAAILSVSGSFLDCTPTIEKPAEAAEATGDNMIRKVLTARHQVFLELVQTESNYVDILKIIVEVFKNELEKSADDEEDQLLNTTEINFIFGKLPPIYETHMKMLEDFRQISADWSEDKCIGNIILKYSGNLLKAYPLYINFFEEMKEVLAQCDQTKPRFHAFLKANQTKPECGRQSLQDLMIRPVQRLGSISLLLNDILKNTPKTNPDHEALEKALAALREVMTHINEDKRKAEGQITLFNIFNDIDNCPPDIVSSHRCFVARTEVVQISTCEGLSSKGSNLVLFLFSDQLEICKKKSKTFNSLKSPSGVSSLQRAMSVKPYKHVKLMPLNTIKRVIDIKDTEDCQRVFSLVCKHTDVIKERLYSFVMIEEEADKTAFLKTLTRQMANNACTADADKFLASLEPHQLDIDTIEPSNGTLSKAIKLATKAKSRVGRAFSFNKTPSKLKRAVSSMMSPFGSSTNLTPASQLSQMRLASCNNVSELGNAENADESPPVVPMSVQPTRKMKASSLGTNALKRL